ncbi:hypothetical protein BJ138DRAFT_993077, partial [Hygrophoropsis aurantiaca]
RCNGCFNMFTATGHSRHLAQTQNPPCVAIYQASIAYIPPPLAAADMDSLGMDLDEETQAENLDEDNKLADYFGTYNEEDIEWPERPRAHPDGSEENHSEPEVADDANAVNDQPNQSRNTRNHAENRLHQNNSVIIPYPDERAGQPTRPDGRSQNSNECYKDRLNFSGSNPWAPFSSQTDWEIARWAKLRGPGSTAFSELLAISGVGDKLGLSYRNSRELNMIIDKKLPSRPHFKHEQVVVAGEAFDIYYRDVIKCVKALYSDPDFAPYLAFRAERHYADQDQTTRLFHDMHTGKWWWETQKQLDARKLGATIIPIIISSDKTQVTMFRNKSAYPVYMTIGNIPKEIR